MIDRLEKDAARYRWLRATNGEDFRDELEGEAGAVGPLMLSEGRNCAGSLDPDEMDAAIDSAMERWPA